ncbi:glycoside-pentoside-hexuronide (GPH):cation symporter [Psychrosphaera aquimarina]|uniref:Glycoside-pentoside-hexuronide (GPH):cation symporter n=1 Tax=Psychrosphaera aquimarina TaxID=2044854 RepID=A0ABU3R057_9GAMM|nr:glycoside-pentoside-hexuronide (GPH):cation symporter [Psychrosphaera aquimarina]MDU0113064.1 glycoside-pentoside-hexuronide (GPH):cation symporter [Psychrosphaera aquimarina]
METNRSTIKQSSVLSLKEKVGYACGDVASNFYWRVFDVFLFIFYTDVFGLSATAVGTMMLVTRLIDAFSDPLMGAMADRTSTKYGKFRPYLLWGIIPIVAAGVLTFTVPDVGESGKLVWAYATYIFMMLAYTFINVPYGALMGVITSDSNQRTTLTSFRFIGAFSGGTLVAYLTPDLVAYLGNGNEILGWQLTMAIYGVVAAGLFFITFLTTKERISPPAEQKTPVLQDIKDLTKNKPWLILFSLALIIMLTITLRGSSGTFYFKYFVGREDLIGSFSMAYMLSLMCGAAITPLLVKFVDKKKLLLILMSLVAILSALFFFVPKENIPLIFTVQILIGLCLGPKSPLVFSMYADTADYSEWKNGRRATAMVFSAAAFAQKLGGAIAGGLMGWLLGSLGYVANQVQNSASEMGIVLLMTLIPAVFAVLAVVCIWFYPLGQKNLEQLQAELKLKSNYQADAVK